MCSSRLSWVLVYIQGDRSQGMIITQELFFSLCLQRPPAALCFHLFREKYSDVRFPRRLARTVRFTSKVIAFHSYEWTFRERKKSLFVSPQMSRSRCHMYISHCCTSTRTLMHDTEYKTQNSCCRHGHRDMHRRYIACTFTKEGSFGAR